MLSPIISGKLRFQAAITSPEVIQSVPTMVLSPMWDVLDLHFLHQLGTVNLNVVKSLGDSLHLELTSLAGSIWESCFSPLNKQVAATPHSWLSQIVTLSGSCSMQICACNWECYTWSPVPWGSYSICFSQLLSPVPLIQIL